MWMAQRAGTVGDGPRPRQDTAGPGREKNGRQKSAPYNCLAPALKAQPEGQAGRYRGCPTNREPSPKSPEQESAIQQPGSRPRRAGELSAPARHVSEWFRQLDRLVRASRIFGKDAPSVLPMRERALEDMAEILQFHAPLLLRCSAVEIWLQDELVVRGPDAAGEDGSRMERRIPFLLYRDGVRAIHMEGATTRNDLEAFLDALTAVANGRSEDSDLVSRLWEIELTGLSFEVAPLETALATNMESATSPRLAGADGESGIEPATDPFDDWCAPETSANVETEWSALRPNEASARDSWRERWKAERTRSRQDRSSELLRTVHTLDGGPEMREALAAMSAGWLAQSIEHGHWQEALEACASLPRPEDMPESVARMLQSLLSGLDVESIAERLDESDTEAQGTFFALTVQLGLQLLQHSGARAGNGDGGAGLVQNFRDGRTDAARGAGDEGGLAREIEHVAYPFSWAAAAAMSSGVPMAKAVASGAFFLESPVSTLPAPIS